MIIVQNLFHPYTNSMEHGHMEKMIMWKKMHQQKQGKNVIWMKNFLWFRLNFVFYVYSPLFIWWIWIFFSNYFLICLLRGRKKDRNRKKFNQKKVDHLTIVFRKEFYILKSKHEIWMIKKIFFSVHTRYSYISSL